MTCKIYQSRYCCSLSETSKCSLCSSQLKLEGKYSREYRSLRQQNSRPPASVILCWVSLSWECITYLLICWFVYIANWCCLHLKNRRFTAFLDSKIHTQLAIVTANELALAIPLGTFPKNFVQICPSKECTRTIGSTKELRMSQNVCDKSQIWPSV